jgi:sugar/nucleoside kinase (ribokinase family)
VLADGVLLWQVLQAAMLKSSTAVVSYVGDDAYGQ